MLQASHRLSIILDNTEMVKKTEISDGAIGKGGRGQENEDINKLAADMTTCSLAVSAVLIKFASNITSPVSLLRLPTPLQGSLFVGTLPISRSVCPKH